MAHTPELSIAGVNFHINYLDETALTEPLPFYSAFVRQAEQTPVENNIDINLSLGCDDKQNPIQDNPIFSTGNSWTLYRQDNRYLFTRYSESHHGPVGWHASCIPDFKQIEVVIPADTCDHWAHGGSGIPALQYPLDEILFSLARAPLYLPRQIPPWLHSGVDHLCRGQCCWSSVRHGER